MTSEFDVLVVGGGVVGLSIALGMAQRNFSVGILEAQSFPEGEAKPDPRVYAINKASRALLETLGAWQLMDNPRISPYSHMHVWDAANGSAIDFDARMIAEVALGAIIEESVLKAALLSKLREEQGITFYPGTCVTGLEEHPSFMQVVSDRQQWQCRLLIIADGRDSVSRNLLKVPIKTWSYHQKALIATVHTTLEHHQTAYQVFTPQGSLAFLPLVDPNKCSIVWSTSIGHAELLLGMEDEVFNESLEEAFEYKLGKVKVLGPRYQFPLIMRHVEQYVGKRWLLMGDAAHTIHPLAGLGLNLGLADVKSWLALIDQSKHNPFSQKMLNAYQRERKNAVWQVIALMEGFKTLFTNPLPPIVQLRGWGLELCNAIGPLKRFFIEHAAGRSG